MIDGALELLECPDDRGALARDGASLRCATCRRGFPIHDEQLVELLPAQPRPRGAMEARYHDGYLEAFRTPFRWDPSAEGWGDLERLSAGHRRFVEKERALVAELLPASVPVLADVSGGAGSFTCELARRAGMVLHGELDVGSLNAAHAAVKRRGAANVLVIRADYLALPIKGRTLDVCLCLDTLERGRAHDELLLCEIARALRPTGVVLADFHHRRPLLECLDRWNGLGTYRPAEFDALAARARLSVERWFEQGCLPAALARLPLYDALDRLFARVLPPIRYLAEARVAPGSP